MHGEDRGIAPFFDLLPEALQEYITEATKYSMGTRALKLFSALAAMATIAQDRFSLDHFGTLKPNLYLLIIGGSGVGKSSHLRQSEFICRCAEIEDRCTDFSGSTEGLITLLSDKQSLGLYLNEYGRLLQSSTKGYNVDLVSTITSLYDCPDSYRISRADRKKSVELESPCLTTYGFSTYSWLIETLDQSQIESGFLPRHLIYEEPECTEIPPARPRQTDRTRLARLSKVIAGAMCRAQKIAFALNADAEAAFERAHKRLFESLLGCSSSLRSFAMRLSPYILKVAMLLEPLYTPLYGPQAQISAQAIHAASYVINLTVELLKGGLLRRLTANPMQVKWMRLEALLSARPFVSYADIMEELGVTYKEAWALAQDLVSRGVVRPYDKGPVAAFQKM